MLTGNILNVREAAELLGYHPEYVRELVRAGVLPARRLGKSYAFDADELREWREARKAARTVKDALGY